MITLQLTTPGIEQAQYMLWHTKPAMLEAAKYAAATAQRRGRSELSTLLTHRYTVDTPAIRKSITATSQGTGAQIAITGPRLRLAHYRLTPAKRPKGQRMKGLMVEIGGRFGSTFYKRGFLTGNKGIRAWRRFGPGRTAGIELIYGPSIPELTANDPEIIKKFTQVVQAAFSKDFNRQLLRLWEGKK